MKRILLGLLFMLLPMAALAAGTSSTAPNLHPDQVQGADQLFGLVKLMTNAFHSKQWALGSGLLLTLVVAAVRIFKLGQKLPDYLVPWVTLGLAIATSVGVGLQAHMAWTSIIGTGLMVGVAAVGGWETVGKMVKGLIDKIRGGSAAPPAAPPAAGGSP